MVYSLSNAGLNVNAQDSKGNTALHLAYMRGYTEIGFKFIEVDDFKVSKILKKKKIINLNDELTIYKGSS